MEDRANKTLKYLPNSDELFSFSVGIILKMIVVWLIVTALHIPRTIRIKQCNN